jgi:hypothetical protein
MPLNNIFDTIKNDVDNLKSDLINWLSNIELNIKSLEELNSKLGGGFDVLQSNFNSIDDRLNNLDSTVIKTTIEDSIKDVESKLDVKHDELKLNIESKLGSTGENISELESKLTTKKDELKLDIETKLGLIEEKLKLCTETTVNESIDNLSSEITEIRENINNLNTTNQIDEKYSLLDNKIVGVNEDFSGKILVLESKLTSIDTKLKDMISKINSSIDSKLNVFQESIMQLRANSVRPSRVLDLTSELSDVKNIIQHLSQDIILNSNEVSTLKVIIDRETENNKALKGDFSAIKERMNNIIASRVRETIESSSS